MSFAQLRVPRSDIYAELRAAGYDYAAMADCEAPQCGAPERTYRLKTDPLAPRLCETCALVCARTRAGADPGEPRRGDLDILAALRRTP